MSEGETYNPDDDEEKKNNASFIVFLLADFPCSFVG
jgi:hypothetical protein